MRLIGLFTDGSATMEVVWFQRIKYIREAYHTATEYVLFGRPQLFNHRWSMVHPEVDAPESAGASQGLRGVYPLTEKLRNRGISTRTMFNWVQNALKAFPDIAETLPENLRSRYNLMGAAQAMHTVHNPSGHAELQRARERLKFEELFSSS